MNYRDKITISPDVMLGKPVIKGTRITVEFVIKKLSEDMNINEILNEYSSLERDNILAAQAYAADVISKEEG